MSDREATSHFVNYPEPSSKEKKDSLYQNCPNCNYELCYIDRATLDDCTMCSFPLPEWMKEKPL